jgi:hypothetical protein
MDVQAFEAAVTQHFPGLADDFQAEPHVGIRMEIFARYTCNAITARDRESLAPLFTFAGMVLEQATLPLRRILLCHYLTHVHFTGLPPDESLAFQQLMPENLQREWLEMNAIIDRVEAAEQGGHL